MTPSALVEQVQSDWEAGAQKDIAPNLIDERGFLEGNNALLDYNGLVFKRGGSVKKSNASFLGSVRFLWDGELGPGHRTVFGGPGAFGVLDSDDATPINVGGGGLSFPTRAVAINDLLFIGSGCIYGGSRKTSPYSTGTVALTNGSATVTGTGTAFAANVDGGMLFRRGTERVYAVRSVTDNTHLTLAEPYKGTGGSGISYALSRTEVLDLGPYFLSDIYAVVANRLVVAIAPNIIQVSKVKDPHTYDPTDRETLPEGVRIVGMAPVGQDLLIFTTKGIWLFRGLAFEQTDPIGNPQWSVTQVSDSIVLWGNAGLAPYAGGVVVPTVDDVVVVDSSGVQSDLGRTGVRREIAHFAQLGYKPGGGQVYRDHYFLPVLDAVNNWVTTLVCRLDLPVRASRRVVQWPWTQLDGRGAQCAAFALRPLSTAGDPPHFLGASIPDGFITDLSGFLEPDANIDKDHDGSTPEFSLITRDYPTVRGGGATGRARHVRLLYEMIAGAFANPLIHMDIATTGLSVPTANWDEVNWNEFEWGADDASAAGFTALAGTFGPDVAVNKGNWNLTASTPYVRFRIRSSDPVAKLSIRALELFCVEPGSARRGRSTD